MFLFYFDNNKLSLSLKLWAHANDLVKTKMAVIEVRNWNAQFSKYVKSTSVKQIKD